MTKPTKRIRLADIAREAGVSIMAVSHVLNGTASGRISVGSEKTKRIKAVARSLNYVPNYAAKQLVKGRSDLIGVLEIHPSEPTISNESLAWQVLGHMDFGQAPTLVRRVPYDHGQVHTAVRELSGRGVRGLVVVAPDYPVDWEELQLGFDVTLPTVCVGRLPMEVPISSVEFDFAKGTELLVAHLVATGCWRIGFMHGDRRLRSSAEKEKGYRRGLERSG